MTIVLQKWLSKWYMGIVREVDNTSIKVVLRGYCEESYKWFDAKSPSILYQVELPQKRNICYFPRCDDYIRCFLVDADSMYHVNSIPPVGKVVASYPQRDNTLVELHLSGNQIRTMEVGNCYLEEIAVETYNEILKTVKVP